VRTVSRGLQHCYECQNGAIAFAPKDTVLPRAALSPAIASSTTVMVSPELITLRAERVDLQQPRSKIRAYFGAV
jgi:hypothetical protein